MLRDLPSLPGELGWATDQGEVRVSEPAAGVVLFVEKGYLGAAFVEKLIGVYERSVEGGGRPHVFIDGGFLTGYEPPLRADLTTWLRKNRGRLGSVHVLVRSRIVKMAIAVSNLTLGGMMHTYNERGPFQIALNQAVARTQAGAPRLLFPPSRGSSA
ncbi:MAG TPA: hypothetical protein VFS43_12860 [Polyangiaceae bacterium]|nr:hypothetical protein [Polyangiaceae bacterium]